MNEPPISSVRSVLPSLTRITSPCNVALREHHPQPVKQFRKRTLLVVSGQDDPDHRSHRTISRRDLGAPIWSAPALSHLGAVKTEKLLDGSAFDPADTVLFETELEATNPQPGFTSRADLIPGGSSDRRRAPVREVKLSVPRSIARWKASG